jgi:hypothetical protein
MEFDDKIVQLLSLSALHPVESGKEGQQQQKALLASVAHALWTELKKIQKHGENLLSNYCNWLQETCASAARDAELFATASSESKSGGLSREDQHLLRVFPGWSHRMDCIKSAKLGQLSILKNAYGRSYVPVDLFESSKSLVKVREFFFLIVRHQILSASLTIPAS